MMTGRCLFLLMSLDGAVLAGPSGTVSAQVILGIDGSIYSSGPDALFVSSPPCRSYQIDVAQTEKPYPNVGRILTSLPVPADVTVSLQLKPDPPPWGKRSSYYATSISRRTTGPHDTRKVRTSSTPGGYYEGVLIGFIPARNGFGRVDLRLSGDREVLLLLRAMLRRCALAVRLLEKRTSVFTSMISLGPTAIRLRRSRGSRQCHDAARMFRSRAAACDDTT